MVPSSETDATPGLLLVQTTSFTSSELDGVKEGVSFCVFPSLIVRSVWFRAIPLSGVVTTGISYRYVRELS